MLNKSCCGALLVLAGPIWILILTPLLLLLLLLRRLPPFVTALRRLMKSVRRVLFVISFAACSVQLLSFVRFGVFAWLAEPHNLCCVCCAV